ncbi:MAG: radical SAM protein [Myxococcales bacterium]|nr:radical SAM protein [Myxococcales bacterium]
MANLGYIQVVRHCNHFCGFCSNPATPFVHDLATMRPLVDDFVRRGYYGVILTGGEPTLHPELPAIAGYARAAGLHVRIITNGTRLADPAYARALADAGVQLAHVSIYSVRPEIEARLRGQADTLPTALAALDSAHAAGIEVNVNCVINRHNADHLDANVRYLTRHHPQVRHFVWNNLDPSMGRAEVNQAQFTPRLADFELSLERALRHLHKSGRTFRVEKVPLCYLGSFGWASTETRKIVKGEERIVHFLDDKQTVRQTDWGHIYAPACDACTLRDICGGLFDRGAAYDPAELAAQFVDPDAIVRTIIEDPDDPSYALRDLAAWRRAFAARLERVPAPSTPAPADGLISVGRVTEASARRYQAKRRHEARLAEHHGVAQEPERED